MAMHLKTRVPLLVVALIVAGMTCATVVTAQTPSPTAPSADKPYVGQPVIDDSSLPRLGKEYMVRNGYAAERTVAGLTHPAAATSDAVGNLYVAQERRTGYAARPVEDDVIQVGTDGTARTIGARLRGPITALAYHQGYVYMAMGYEPTEIRRLSVKTGKIARVFWALGASGVGQVPKAFIDLQQRPGSKALDLLALDQAGSLWRIAYDGSGWLASSTTPKPAATPVAFLGTQGIRVAVGLGILLLLAVLLVNWVSRNRI